MTRARIAAIVLALAPTVAAPLAAQEDKQDKLARLRDEKIAAKVFERADWKFDYDEARAKARRDHKLIFAYFTRSYAG